MNVRLVGVSGSQAGREILIEDLPVVIGRGESAGIRLDDRWASRLHCRIERGADAIWIYDLSSTHGTLVNGRPIGEAPLASGDRVTIGLSHFRFETAGDEPSCERPAADHVQAADRHVPVCAV